MPTATNADNIECNSNPCYGTDDLDVMSNPNNLALTIDGLGVDDLIIGGNGDDQLWGSEDIIYGNFGRDGVLGGQGNDKIDGGDGNDILAGNRENDEISGGEGDDNIWGDGETGLFMRYAGSDKLYGGPGNDWIDSSGGQRLQK